MTIALAFAGAACGPGLNAGTDGGLAFIGLTIMLVIVGAIMWWAIGRED